MTAKALQLCQSQYANTECVHQLRLQLGKDWFMLITGNCATHTRSLMLSFLRLRHISAALICCRVSLANRKRSFSSLGAADAQALAPKRRLSSSICFNIPKHVHKSVYTCLQPTNGHEHKIITCFKREKLLK